jgi:hypothetical protein
MTNALASIGAAIALLTAAPALASADAGAPLGAGTLCDSAIAVDLGNQVYLASGGLAGLLAQVRVATGLIGVRGDVAVVVQSALCPRR